MTTTSGAAPVPHPDHVVRPFRFGIQASALPGGTAATDAAGWHALARRVEELGYATLTVADHLDDQLAPVPALMAVADATTTLRIGTLVCGNDFRHPVVLAKELATVDLLSGGRLEAGIGAGWESGDYASSGIVLDRPGRRIERLAEAVDVITGLWSDGLVDHDGTHYRVRGLDGRPKPHQRPRPPLLLGGGGRRMLSLAGARADIVGLNVSLAKGVIDADAGPDATGPATLRKLAWVAAAAADRWAGVELQVRVHLAMITDDRNAAADMLAGGFGLTPAEALASPHALVGTVEEIVDDLLDRRARYGISYIGLSVDAVDTFAPVVARLAGR